MAEEINYDDDLFFIITRLQLLKNGLMLSLDEQYMKEYYLNDLVIIDKSLTMFQEKLTSNPHLIKLGEYMHALSRAQGMFVEIIHKIKEYDTNFNMAFKEQEIMLDNSATRQSNGALALIDRLKEGIENYKDVDIISEEELSILMSTD